MDAVHAADAVLRPKSPGGDSLTKSTDSLSREQRLTTIKMASHPSGSTGSTAAVAPPPPPPQTSTVSGKKVRKDVTLHFLLFFTEKNNLKQKLIRNIIMTLCITK